MRFLFFMIATAALMLLLAPQPTQAKVLTVEKVATPSGLNVWLAEDKSVPVVTLAFSFDGGLRMNPPSKPGVARMAALLLDEGAGDMTAEEFQTQLSDNDIRLEFEAGRDAFTGQLRTLKDNRTLAFDLLALALRAPRLDADAITRMRNANAARLRDDMGNPAWLVARVFNGTVFADHPYGQPGFGTLDSLSQIGKRDLQQFLRAQIVRRGLNIVFAGDITRDDARAAAEKIFGGLPPGDAEPAESAPPVLAAADKTILLPLDAPQTYVLAGAPGVGRRDKDWAAAAVLNFILGGGGFESRLMRELRDKRGLTYGANSVLTDLKQAPLLQVSFSSSNEKTAEALTVLRREWMRLGKEGATAQEVDDAVAALTGSLALELTSTPDVAEALNAAARAGFDSDAMDRQVDALGAVTVADVKRVAARLLKPERLTVVLVGRPRNVTADMMLDTAPGVAAPGETP